MQLGTDMSPLRWTDLAGIASSALVLASYRMGQSRLLACALQRIAFEFTRNCRAVASNGRSNARNADAVEFEGVNLVSFCLGQVCIGHGASLRLAGHKELILCTLGQTGF